MKKLIIILISIVLTYIFLDSIYGYYTCEKQGDIWFGGKSAGSRLTHSGVDLNTTKVYFLGYCAKNQNK